METSQGIKTEFVEGLKIYRQKTFLTERKQEFLIFGILYKVDLQLVIGVSGQFLGPMLSWNVGPLLPVNAA